MLDILIRGGTVIDGSGKDGYLADIGIKDGKISVIGQVAEEAAQVICAKHKTVCPGFIDIHRHADAAVFRKDFGELELRQGLTTVINGNCGLSLAPIVPERRDAILNYLKPIIGAAAPSAEIDSMKHYLSSLGPLPISVGMLVGAGVLRANAAGYSAEPLTDAQYRDIHTQMERALREGAFGVSLGLGYAPECFYSTQELIRALEPLRDSTVPFTVHIREEGTAVDRAVEEMLSVAEALHCPLHISHLKAMGTRNWDRKIPAVLARLQEAREKGLDVSWDVYPYTAGSTQLLHIMPPELLDGGTEEICRKLLDDTERRRLKERLASGTDFDNISSLVGWDNIYMTTLNCPENRQFIGKSVREISALRGQSPEDCVFDMLAEEKCTITMIDFITAESDIARILQSDAVNVISDATYPSEGKPHPRMYGTFARILETYVQQAHILTLPQAIHKMTQTPAEALHIPNKGLLRVGYDADVLIFDPAQIRENATYAEPTQFASGFDVIVGGKAALINGKLLCMENGSVLRRQQDVEQTATR